MKKTTLMGAFIIALLGTLAFQSCNSEKKAEGTDTTTIDTMMTDTTMTPTDTVPIDTGMKGTKVPEPK